VILAGERPVMEIMPITGRSRVRDDPPFDPAFFVAIRVLLVTVIRFQRIVTSKHALCRYGSSDVSGVMGIAPCRHTGGHSTTA